MNKFKLTDFISKSEIKKIKTTWLRQLDKSIKSMEFLLNKFISKTNGKSK